MMAHFADWAGAALSALGLFIGLFVEWLRLRRGHWE